MNAKLRDGTELEIGDEVETKFPGCKGHTFIVCEINPYDCCESGTLVVVHLKGDPERKILGLKKHGHEHWPDGIDACWFSKIKQNNIPPSTL